MPILLGQALFDEIQGISGSICIPPQDPGGLDAGSRRGGEEVITLSDERMELVDFVVRPKAKIIGKVLSKELPKDSLVGLVIRDGVPEVPTEDFRAAAGDRILVMSMPHVISKVKKEFIP